MRGRKMNKKRRKTIELPGTSCPFRDRYRVIVNNENKTNKFTYIVPARLVNELSCWLNVHLGLTATGPIQLDIEVVDTSIRKPEMNLVIDCFVFN
jgi:hypothetical protein